jgi:NADPH-dependent 2,4-dienoyl-CoA reductase/sulfur reductase-like enzyme
VELLVCGGGPAGHAAVRAYREAGGTGDVLLATAEPRRPYARPPLSKDYLRGEMAADELPLEPAGWYAERGVELALGAPVRGLAPDARVALVAGEPVAYGRCVLATGAEPARLPVPGGDDERVLLLREPPDSDRIRALAPGRVLVVGTGFVGCEVAASLALIGAEVTLVGEEEVPQLDRLGRQAGQRIAGWLREAGVQLVGGHAVARIEDARAVVLDDGRRVEAEAVVVGAGTRPRAALAETAGLELERGRVPCDASLRTAAAGVLAAGDVALAHNAAAGRRLVVEHWGEAERMGEVAGRVAAGREDAWSQAPGFWSTIGDRTLKHVAWGDGFDEARLVGGDDGAFAVHYGRDGVLVGVLAHGRDEVYERGRELVERAAPISESLATDPASAGAR